jgi:hypothetical protein
MQSTPETSHENGSEPSNLDELSAARSNDEYMALTRDRPPRAGYGDLELGSAPGLPADSPQHHDESDSDFDFEIHGQDWVRRKPPLSCSMTGLVAWCKGPDPPHVHRVKPWFPKWQAAPAHLVERCLPRRRMKIVVLVGGVLSWAVIFFLFLKSSAVDQEVLGYGQPVKLSCHQRFWYVLFVLSTLHRPLLLCLY